MSCELEMSMMGELTFFLGLQIKQSSQGTSICQEKYIKELLNKFKMLDAKVLDMPMNISVRIDKDKAGKEVKQTMYRKIIGSLLYLTARRPDIMFSVGMCARFQAAPKELHLKAAKRVLLCRFCGGSKEYLKNGTFLGISSNVMGNEEAELGGFIYCLSGVRCYCCMLCPNLVDQATIGGFWGS
ncbi:uncharacterized mitochondrial protein AtMg00810-like [Solanum lycopersicum]|uniref:uncharacterized mitochondrial protein AtMg00810-like n=1 Tax=Solanum lycopersicum TaxID=4081 RepID=UPI0002BC975E